MLKEATVLYKVVKDLQKDLLPLLAALENKTVLADGIEQTDTAYACREAIEILKDLTTRVNKVSSMAKLMANHFAMSRDMSRIRTDYCSATPKPRLWYKITVKRDKDPEEHDLLQRFCGVPQEMAEREVLRIHSPNFMDYLTELVGIGQEIPVDHTKLSQTEFDLSIRRKKDIA